MAKTTVADLERLLGELASDNARMKGELARHGIYVEARGAAEVPSARADYIEHGSPEHAAFLGLVLLGGDVACDVAREQGYVVYGSPETGQHYRLADELTAARAFPMIDPSKAILMVLREKASGFESGPPRPPANAPSMWSPDDFAAQLGPNLFGTGVDVECAGS